MFLPTLFSYLGPFYYYSPILKSHTVLVIYLLTDRPQKDLEGKQDHANTGESNSHIMLPRKLLTSLMSHGIE